MYKYSHLQRNWRKFWICCDDNICISSLGVSFGCMFGYFMDWSCNYTFLSLSSDLLPLDRSQTTFSGWWHVSNGIVLNFLWSRLMNICLFICINFMHSSLVLYAVICSLTEMRFRHSILKLVQCILLLELLLFKLISWSTFRQMV
mgnify:CR=1 FL=1